jgi:DNA-binding phage protein
MATAPESVKSFVPPPSPPQSALGAQIGAGVPGIGIAPAPKKPDLGEPEIPESAFAAPSIDVQGLVSGIQSDIARLQKEEAAAREGMAGLSQRQLDTIAEMQRLNEEAATLEAQKNQVVAEAKAAIARHEKESSQQIEKRLQDIRTQFPYPEFHPTKDNLQSLATLFGLMGVVSIAMGGAGKQSGLQAMKAMTGMMEGWRQGRIDQWQREKDEFDKNLQRQKAILDDAYKDAERAYKMLAYDRQEAEALAEQAAAKLGGQIARIGVKVKGVEWFFKYLDDLHKDFNEIWKQSAVGRVQEIESLAKIAASSSRGTVSSAVNRRMAMSSLLALVDSTKEVENITQLPAGSVGAGIFSGMARQDPKNIHQAIETLIGQALTTDDQKFFTTLVSALEAHVARLSGMGAVSAATLGNIELYKKQIPKSGEDAMTGALFLARIKQELDAGAEVLMVNPDAAPDMKKLTQEYRKKLDEAVPFDVKDVLNVSSGASPRVKDQMNKILNLPSIMTGEEFTAQSGEREGAGTMRAITREGKIIYWNGQEWVPE